MIQGTDQAPSMPRSARRTRGRTISVFLVEDHAAVRRGVQGLLGDEPDLRVIGSATHARGALSDIARLTPRVVVIDYHLAGENGLWLVEQLAQLPAPPRTLIYSAFADPTLAAAALVSGAHGIVSKASLGDELCNAIRTVARGRLALPTLSRAEVDRLASRLREDDRPVLRMLAHGLRPDETSRALRLTSERLRAARARIVRDLTRAVHPTNPRRLARMNFDRARRRHWTPFAGPAGA
jgi:DNA-binding NarL/FixJ family response regulator